LLHFSGFEYLKYRFDVTIVAILEEFYAMGGSRLNARILDTHAISFGFRLVGSQANNM
jgi:hypothetical protein